jgi:hypothetical protein
MVLVGICAGWYYSISVEGTKGTRIFALAERFKYIGQLAITGKPVKA